MNKKFWLTTIVGLFATVNVNASSVSTGTGSVKLPNTNCKNGVYNGNKKKLRFGVEFGGRARLDYGKLSIKQDIGEKAKNLKPGAEGCKLSQTQLTTFFNEIGEEIPDLRNRLQNIQNMSDTYKNAWVRNMQSIEKTCQEKGTALTINDISQQIDSICDILNISNNNAPKTWAKLHDLEHAKAIPAILADPSLLSKNDITIDTINDTLVDNLVKSKIILAIDPDFLTKNLTLDGVAKTFEEVAKVMSIYKQLVNPTNSEMTMSSRCLDYINWDLFVNLFLNYSVSENVYLIAGIGGIFDLSGSKGRSMNGKKSKQSGSSSNSTSSSSNAGVLEEFEYYSIKYAITPKIGVGIQCSKHFAIELSVFDQITKVQYDCSSIYNKTAVSALRAALPNITEIFPDKKQSNWVNRFGAELGFRFNINERFFAKFGVFYLFPTNITKKIQPFDFKLQSVGASFSLGLTF